MVEDLYCSSFSRRRHSCQSGHRTQCPESGSCRAGSRALSRAAGQAGVGRHPGGCCYSHLQGPAAVIGPLPGGAGGALGPEGWGTMQGAGIADRTTGSTLLQPLGELLNLPLDQVNFAVCQFVALLAAFWFRIYLSHRNATPVVRHAFATVFGIYLAVFCFGWYSLHIFMLVLLSYTVMVATSIPNLHRYSFVVAMGYLTLCQISRVYIFNYGILSTDFSGPMMIITQKITSLAFQVHDGIGRNVEELTPDQLRLAVKTKPSFLEYLSYHLNFMSILAGPCSNYNDYIAFIEGRHVQMKLMEVNWKQNGHDRLPNPSPNGAVLHKLCLIFIFLILFFAISKTFLVVHVVDDNFISETSVLWRCFYLYLATQARKPKYYFAWILADAVNNAAGYGFSGVDKKGNFQWDLLSTINIWNIETSTSFKMYVDNWNIPTAVWLKRVCYDRVPRYPTALTFVLSALWHGVYPGYYFTFFTAIPVMLAARAIRNNFRHYFISSKTHKFIYDIITWIVTQHAVCYTVAPFTLLALEPSIKWYRSMYFHLHILSFLVLLILPIKPSGKTKKQTEEDTVNHKKVM